MSFDRINSIIVLFVKIILCSCAFYKYAGVKNAKNRCGRRDSHRFSHNIVTLFLSSYYYFFISYLTVNVVFLVNIFVRGRFPLRLRRASSQYASLACNDNYTRIIIVVIRYVQKQ